MYKYNEESRSCTLDGIKNIQNIPKRSCASTAFTTQFLDSISWPQAYEQRKLFFQLIINANKFLLVSLQKSEGFCLDTSFQQVENPLASQRNIAAPNECPASKSGNLWNNIFDMVWIELSSLNEKSYVWIKKNNTQAQQVYPITKTWWWNYHGIVRFATSGPGGPAINYNKLGFLTLIQHTCFQSTWNEQFVWETLLHHRSDAV